MAPRKKKPTARKASASNSETVTSVMPAPVDEERSSMLSGKTIAILAAVVLLLGLAFLKKEWFVAAVVDNKPIFTWELNSTLQKRFGGRVLEQMIDEILIMEEAQKQGINVSDDEVEEKVKEVEAQVGGAEAMKKFLDLQGLTQEDLRNQLKIKAIVDQILAKQIQVTEKEIQDFLTQNQEALPATDAANLKVMAEQAVREEKTSNAFQKWYDGLKNKYKIYKFY